MSGNKLPPLAENLVVPTSTVRQAVAALEPRLWTTRGPTPRRLPGTNLCPPPSVYSPTAAVQLQTFMLCYVNRLYQLC